MNLEYIIEYDNILLRPLEVTDIENMRIWRNNSANNKYLRNIGKISKEQQMDWYNKYINDKSEFFFAIVEVKKLHRMVGALSLYNINKTNADIGKIQIGDNDVHGLGIGKKSLVMLMKLGFEKLSFETITGIVNKDNIAAVINDIAVGFKITGEQKSLSQCGGDDFKLEINYDRLKALNKYIGDINIKQV